MALGAAAVGGAPVALPLVDVGLRAASAAGVRTGVDDTWVANIASQLITAENTAQTDVTESGMCRNIRPLFNFEPPATDAEIRAAALQFVRKISGFTHPSKANGAAFTDAVDEVSQTAHRLLQALETAQPARDRETETMKARARAKRRFA
jgi:hypothetical protein